MNCVRFAHQPSAHLCCSTRHLNFPIILHNAICRFVSTRRAPTLGASIARDSYANSTLCGCRAFRQNSADHSAPPSIYRRRSCVDVGRRTSSFSRAVSSTANGTSLTASRPAFMPQERIRQLKVIRACSQTQMTTLSCSTLLRLLELLFLLQEDADNRIGETVEIRGWVRTVRNQKAFSFMEVYLRQRKIGIPSHSSSF